MEPIHPKSKTIEMLNRLPEDVTFEEILDKVHTLYRIAQSVEEAEKGETIPHEEARRRFKEQRAKDAASRMVS